MSPARIARSISLAAVMLSISGAASLLRAADEAPATSTTPGAAASTPNKVEPGDNAWVLTSSALVLMMTGPGLALFYSGLVRKKNVLSVMMQCIFLMCLMTVIWALYGFGIAFGNDPEAAKTSEKPATWKGYVGDVQYYLFMNHVAPTWNDQDNAPRMENFRSPVDGSAMTVPTASFMLFQCMFFIITPALICGAFAERMKFSTMVVFMVLWGTFIYCPLAHWVWGGGILSYGSKHATGIFSGGALDFAGGTVVHISSGVSALICALLLGKRLGYGKTAMPPHNLTYTAIGAAMLWVGWFGFNAGSAGSAGHIGQRGLHGHPFLRRRRGIDLGRAGVDLPRQAERAGGLLGSGRRTGLHHARFRVCDAHAGLAHGRRRFLRLLHGLHAGQGQIRL